jgi:farnesyl-diphosphate farnesyltransferase
LRARILGESTALLNFGELAERQDSTAERALLQGMEETLLLLEGLETEDRQRIREVLSIITSGQELDLRRFAGASAKLIHCLHGDIDLEDYTYRVAGCVGEFWTKMCLAHLFEEAAMPAEELLANGVRFGKGLQLVNILRDLSRDLRNGRCYIPSELLTTAELTPADLLKAGSEDAFRVIYDPLLERAQSYLAAGWSYTNALPRDQKRLRLACAWPVLIGARTLNLLRTVNPLDPALHIKVPRGEVYRILLGSVVRLPFPDRWRDQFIAG